MDPKRHKSLMEELTSITTTVEERRKIGHEVLRQLLLSNPNLMKVFRPIQSMTLPQALNSSYLGQLSVKFVDSLLEVVRNYNDQDVLRQTIIQLANIHKNRGITVAHFVAVIPLFTDTLANFLQVEENKECLQEILTTILPMIGKRL
ncbi:hypothetical protein CSKR_111193 [Clonorchis sinensis]|uniref:Globin domain-containing protein n=1 Tax=Clonorchis sinensis TaxID=79923 RepID=A0A3R7K0H1_CLOSI|nr:hypothetical protein CSKR_111193 [Clonorchis sinensis]